ncbi:hypothetical protein GOBAR_DD18976 [Gossypium barbadense]|nr:hypothetical protein GOBAR_DD18976 [Gossypium barbadense]
MVALYCWNQNGHTESIQLFAESVDVELVEDFTPLSEEHGVQDPCTEVLRASVDRRSTVRRFDIDLNALPTSENLNTSPHLQIHLVMIKTDTDGEDGCDNNSPSNHKVEDYSDPNLDKVLYDIDNEGTNIDKNLYASSVGNLSRGIVIHNYPEAYMLIVYPNAMHASKFLEYPNILITQRLAATPNMRSFLWAKNLQPKKTVYFRLSGIAYMC